VCASLTCLGRQQTRASTPGADYNGDAAAEGGLAVPPHYWSTSSVGCALLRDNTRPAPGTSLRTRGHRTALPWRQEMRDHPRCLITRRSESELIKIWFGKSAGCDFDFPKASAYWSITVLERLGQLSSLLNDAFFFQMRTMHRVVWGVKMSTADLVIVIVVCLMELIWHSTWNTIKPRESCQDDG
jgi:hypothetical protein